MKYLYGPVTSRRLGTSLGVDILKLKTCSFDCVYCQLGKTAQTILERCEWVPVEAVLEEIRQYFLSEAPKPDYITFSGSGEPTLHSELGRLISGIRQLTKAKVAVITNSSLITSPQVRRELLQADLVVPSLDAATQPVFEHINRPAPGLEIDSIIDGLRQFRKNFSGGMRLEILMVEGINDTAEELKAIRNAVHIIKPDSIDVNTVARPPAEKSAAGLSPQRLAEVAAFLGMHARATGSAEKVHRNVPGDIEDKIVALLRRRPCGIAEICSSLGIETGKAAAALVSLSQKGLVAGPDTGEDGFYRAR